MDVEQRRSLSLLATALDALERESGAALAKAFVKQRNDHHLLDPEDSTDTAGDVSTPISWRLGKIRALSFRGLAASGQPWEHDFEGRSHLLYGPNGCGKSSLLGAIAWCLTGCVFRDDCSPDASEDITVYTDADNARSAGTRPDALSLTDSEGQTTDADAEYWVELEFRSNCEDDDGPRLWLRRHSVDGLSNSADGENWTTANRLDDVGIAELDAELHAVMPARVPHIRFGKDSDLLSVFSQLVGLDDLERIAKLASRALRALNTERSKLQNTDIPAQETTASEAVTVIKEHATEAIRGMESYPGALADARTLKEITTFNEALSETMEAARTQLADDLGVEIHPPDSPSAAEVSRQLNLLPGQVDTAVSTLTKPLSDIMVKTLGLTLPSSEEVDLLTQGLETFEGTARKQVHERLKWAVEQAKDEKASLMLAAAEEFPEGSEACPVCTQDLEPVPDVQQRLAELRPLAGQPHLKQAIADLERALLADLNTLVSVASRVQGKQTLAGRLLADWSALKETTFPALLTGVAERFDKPIQELSEDVPPEPAAERLSVIAGYDEQFSGTFADLDTAVAESWQYIQLLRSALKNRDKIQQELTRILKSSEGGGTEQPLCVLLQRGNAINSEIEALADVQKSVVILRKARKELDVLQARAEAFQGAATAITPTKDLTIRVQQAVVDVVRSVEPKMKELYGRLYRDEILDLDMLTPGHAANPHKRDEINAYFRAGEQRVPAAPFSNSGRFRALILSFVFALLDRSHKTLDLLLLDDPALSLDDEHKSRFVQDLIGPSLSNKQVIVGTHYRDFYERAKLTFVGEECWELIPRRTVSDAVTFETGDLLVRLEKLPPSGRRDAAPNLRRWIESALGSLSGYCPAKGFVVYNNIVQSIDNYAAITDPRVATPERDRIVTALRSPEVEWVRNPVAHTGHRTPQEIEDALSCLRECNKDLLTELGRFKKLSARVSEARALPPIVEFAPLRLDGPVASASMPIVTQAAAAHDGMAIAVDEHAIAHIAESRVALLKLDSLQPLARPGQHLLLDPEEREPGNGELVVAETDSGDRYARRFWRRDDAICLEAQNVTPHYHAPVILTSGTCRAQRIIGVVFEPCRTTGAGRVSAEWVPPSGDRLDLLKDVVGIRVKGTSLEPVAWDGQIALVRRRDDVSSIEPKTLACVDIDGEGAVIKRCYPSADEWLLCTINVNEPQEPMRVHPSTILHVYPLIGVLFEIVTEEPTEAT